MKISLGTKIIQIANGKCPHCGKGDIYKKNDKPYPTFPVMKNSCDVCRYNFNGEPGYFLGAMYVSYGLAVFEGIAAFLIATLFVHEFSGILLASIVAGVILIFAIPNYKFSRIIWMYLFPYSK